jgi:hypothetical protein
MFEFTLHISCYFLSSIIALLLYELQVLTFFVRTYFEPKLFLLIIFHNFTPNYQNINFMQSESKYIYILFSVYNNWHG